MEEESCVPPGFRFHPTEEELVGYYLARKVASQKIDLEIIQDIDLYRIEPWDLQERCNKYGHEEQSELYFFCYKDRKYPSGTRTNRATAAGFWKATGRDKPILSKTGVIGMRKTLVFYKGRAPNGRKTDWIIHEYQLQTNDQHVPPQEEGWVVCRAFQKPTPNQRPYFTNLNPMYYDNSNARIRQDALTNFDSPTIFMDSYQVAGNTHHHQIQSSAGCVEELEPKKMFFNQAIHIPQLESSSLSGSLSAKEFAEGAMPCTEDCSIQVRSDPQGQVIDWNFLDSLLSPQFNETAPSSSQIV